jgi:hypothetical protein
LAAGSWILAQSYQFSVLILPCQESLTWLDALVTAVGEFAPAEAVHIEPLADGFILLRV